MHRTALLLAGSMYAASAQHSISWWQSARDTGDRLTPQPPMAFTPAGSSATPRAGSTANSTTAISIDSTVQFQTILGFGGAVTESAVYVFNKLDAAGQAGVVADLYGDNGNGTSLRYTMGRLTIGSCDFALGYYSYNDKANDTAMTNFTIAHDEAAIIPFILQAQAAAAARSGSAGNSTLRWLSTPWSPPAWMKSNGLMSCFPLGPLDCALLPEYQPAYALYFSKYLTAYKAAGVNIIAITVQNEPQPQTGTLTYEGMWFPFTAELEFVSEYLGPRLAADHPEISIFIFDHNQADALLYAAPILADPVAAQYVAGTAFHWYSGPDFTPLAELHDLFPNKMLLATEATVGRGTATDWYKTPDWSNGEYYSNFIINDLNNWAVGFLDWNILLDENGAPDHGDPTGELCEGLIQCGSDAMLIADTSVNPPVVYKQAFYWHMGHVSRFIPPGSVRINATLSLVATSGTAASEEGVIGSGGSSSNGSVPILATAFTTPAGATVVVLLNAQNGTQTVVLSDARWGTVTATMPPHSIQTWQY